VDGGGGPFVGGRGLTVAWNGTYWLAAGNSYETGDTIAVSSDGGAGLRATGPNFTNRFWVCWPAPRNGSIWVLTGSDQHDKHNRLRF
jgi:hypothetical protein